MQPGSPSREFAFWPKKSARMESPRSSDSSWTEEICHNALAYLDSGSDSEGVPTKMSRSSSKEAAKDFSFKQDNSRPADSTQDESSFLSAENPSNQTSFTQNNSITESIDVFQPTLQKQGSHIVQQNTFNFYPE